MRTSMIFRALVLAGALAAPLSQAALAGQQEQQALSNHAAITSSINGGAYSNDATLSPAVGD